MSVKVCKFGGSSVSCAENFKKVKDIVLSDEMRKVIVVSALGKRFSCDEKITDLLINIDSCAKNGANFIETLKKIKERFLEIKSRLGLKVDLEREFSCFEGEIASGKFSTDYIVSRGEYFTAKLMAEYLGFAFVDSINTLVFDYTGKLNEGSSKRNLASELEKHGNVVIPGFYGGYPNGCAKLFVRGGGDISGAIIASLLNASVYENWTDVDGVMTANPQIISTAKCVSAVSYEQFEQMSLMGASVVNDGAIEVVKKYAIPINVRNTFNTSCVGTVISSCTKSQNGAIGVTGKRNCFLIEILQTENKTQDLIKLLSLVKRYRIKQLFLTCSVNVISLVAENLSSDINFTRFIFDVKNELKNGVRLQKDVSVVCVTTRSFSEVSRVLANVIRCLEDNYVGIKSVIKSSSDFSFLIVCDNKDYERALKEIHSKLFE